MESVLLRNMFPVGEGNSPCIIRLNSSLDSNTDEDSQQATQSSVEGAGLDHGHSGFYVLLHEDGKDMMAHSQSLLAQVAFTCCENKEKVIFLSERQLLDSKLFQLSDDEVPSTKHAELPLVSHMSAFHPEQHLDYLRFLVPLNRTELCRYLAALGRVAACEPEEFPSNLIVHNLDSFILSQSYDNPDESGEATDEDIFEERPPNLGDCHLGMKS